MEREESEKREKVYPGDWSCHACGVEDEIEGVGLCWACYGNYVGLTLVSDQPDPPAPESR